MGISLSWEYQNSVYLKTIHSGHFDHTATLRYVSITNTADLKESGRAISAYSISFTCHRCPSDNSFGAHKELASGYLFSKWRFLRNSLSDLKLSTAMRTSLKK